MSIDGMSAKTISFLSNSMIGKVGNANSNIQNFSLSKNMEIDEQIGEVHNYQKYNVRVKSIRFCDPDSNFAILEVVPKKGNIIVDENGREYSYRSTEGVVFKLDRVGDVEIFAKENKFLYCVGYWFNDERFGQQFICTDVSFPMVSDDAEIKLLLKEEKSLQLNEKGVNLIYNQYEEFKAFEGQQDFSFKDFLCDPTLIGQSLELIQYARDLEDKGRISSKERQLFFRNIVIFWQNYRQKYNFSEMMSKFGIGMGKANKIFDYIFQKEQEVKNGVAGSLSYLKQLTDFEIAKDYPNNLDELIYNKFVENVYSFSVISGIGFKTLDDIALKIGYPRDDIRRISGAILHVLNQFLSEGNTVCPFDLFKKGVIELLKGKGKILTSSELEIFTKAVKGLIEEKKILIFESIKQNGKDVGKCVVLDYSFLTEFEIANTINELLENSIDIDDKALALIASDKLSLDDSQRKGVELAYKNRFSIITGGPGVGKTHTVKTAVDILLEFEPQNKIILLAPTGKAAKEVRKSLGRELTQNQDIQTSTIHLYLAKGGFSKKDTFNKTKNTTFVIDESSMLDIFLANKFFYSIDPNTCRVILIGDVDQIEPVGSGQVFADLFKVTKKNIPIARLTFNHRVEKGSRIPEVAKMINEGKMPLENGSLDNDDDYVFLQANDNESAVKILKETLISLREKGVNCDNVQILSSINNGLVGVNEINKVVKFYLNPNLPLEEAEKNFERFLKKIEEQHRGFYKEYEHFYDSDRVLCVKNNYQIDLFNGEIGFYMPVAEFENDYEDDFFSSDDDGLFSIRDTHDTLDEEFQTPLFRIRTPFAIYPIQKNYAKNIRLGYCTTVHKSQGGEAPIVIVLAPKSHYNTLRRKLLYTGVTRAKRQIIFIGDKSTCIAKVKDFSNLERITSLPLCFEKFDNAKTLYNTIVSSKSETERLAEEELVLVSDL